MFGKGEYIVYGTAGVCLVKDITAMAMEEGRQEKLYYVLEPMGISGSRIMTPVEGNKSVMRPILSREEAYLLIDGIKEVDELGITDDKQRETKYKEALMTCDCRQCTQIIQPALPWPSQMSGMSQVLAHALNYWQRCRDCWMDAAPPIHSLVVQ